MHGWIILDKPSGITSAHAVAKVKKMLTASLRAKGEAIQNNTTDGLPRPPAFAGAKGTPRNDKVKIGHAGTLDPLASGILPLALGEATKTVPYMMDGDKSYAFTVIWGEERDTDDSEGKIVQISLKRPHIDEIIALLPRFTGKISQMPPSYSAVHVGGRRAYDLARQGEVVELAAREVRVESLNVIASVAKQSSAGSLRPDGLAMTSFICHCGKGVYIRSLARDMGRLLGCFGYISSLRRLKVGRFDETHAISLEVIEKMVHKSDLGFLQPVESALDDIPAVNLTVDQASRLRRGQEVVLPMRAETPTVCAYCDGILIAICGQENGRLWPVRVFNL